MTYTALLSLSILESDMTKVDKAGISLLLKSSQQEDGRCGTSYATCHSISQPTSFTGTPGWGESDVRITYAAFAISHLIGDWTGIDVPKALSFVRRCQVSIDSLGFYAILIAK